MNTGMAGRYFDFHADMQHIRVGDAWIQLQNLILSYVIFLGQAV
jgi:hypothetical protein